MQNLEAQSRFEDLVNQTDERWVMTSQPVTWLPATWVEKRWSNSKLPKHKTMTPRSLPPTPQNVRIRVEHVLVLS